MSKFRLNANTKNFADDLEWKLKSGASPVKFTYCIRSHKSIHKECQKPILETNSPTIKDFEERQRCDIFRRRQVREDSKKK